MYFQRFIRNVFPVIPRYLFEWDEDVDSYNKRKKSAGFCMKSEKGPGIFGVIVFLLLPCLLTVVFSGRKACPVIREIEIEDYIPAVTAAQISWDAPIEAIKAQTVIARSNLYLEWKKGEASGTIQEASQELKKRNMDDLFLEKFQRFQEASADTEGQMLMKDGEVKEIPYHELSQGKTREAAQILGEAFSYVPQLDTPADTESPDYIKGFYFTLEDLKKKLIKSYPGFTIENAGQIEIKNTDNTGYVLEIQIGNQEFQGEKLRELLSLPSSCFTIQTLEDEIRFLCKGQGHGLGLSQHTAIKMAEEDKTYKEILSFFFPELSINRK